jgi:hypothetical protein
LTGPCLCRLGSLGTSAAIFTSSARPAGGGGGRGAPGGAGAACAPVGAKTSGSTTRPLLPGACRCRRAFTPAGAGLHACIARAAAHPALWGAWGQGQVALTGGDLGVAGGAVLPEQLHPEAAPDEPVARVGLVLWACGRVVGVGGWCSLMHQAPGHWAWGAAGEAGGGCRRSAASP